jgi:hypothetical protein
MRVGLESTDGLFEFLPEVGALNSISRASMSAMTSAPPFDAPVLLTNLLNGRVNHVLRKYIWERALDCAHFDHTYTP